MHEVICLHRLFLLSLTQLAGSACRGLNVQILGKVSKPYVIAACALHCPLLTFCVMSEKLQAARLFAYPRTIMQMFLPYPANFGKLQVNVREKTRWKEL